MFVSVPFATAERIDVAVRVLSDLGPPPCEFNLTSILREYRHIKPMFKLWKKSSRTKFRTAVFLLRDAHILWAQATSSRVESLYRLYQNIDVRCTLLLNVNIQTTVVLLLLLILCCISYVLFWDFDWDWVETISQPRLYAKEGRYQQRQRKKIKKGRSSSSGVDRNNAD